MDMNKKCVLLHFHFFTVNNSRFLLKALDYPAFWCPTGQDPKWPFCTFIHINGCVGTSVIALVASSFHHSHDISTFRRIVLSWLDALKERACDHPPLLDIQACLFCWAHQHFNSLNEPKCFGCPFDLFCLCSLAIACLTTQSSIDHAGSQQQLPITNVTHWINSWLFTSLMAVLFLRSKQLLSSLSCHIWTPFKQKDLMSELK